MNNIKIGITGLPQAGKTLTLIKVIEMLEAEGLKVGGMITEPMAEKNHKGGFYVIDWRTKQKGILASSDIKASSPSESTASTSGSWRTSG
jgi:nucleoside-triphosphatase